MLSDIDCREILQQTIENARKELPFTLQVKDLLKILPFSDTRIYEMLNQGKIPGKKIDGKWVIPTTSFLAWLHGVEKDKHLDEEIFI